MIYYSPDLVLIAYLLGLFTAVFIAAIIIWFGNIEVK